MAYEAARERMAYWRGRAEANAEWRDGRATIYTSGKPSPFKLTNLDQDTGLPYQAIAGCVITPTIWNRQAGHNDRIHELIQRHGPPPNSFKRWKHDLFNLTSYFRTLSVIQRPRHIEVGGPDVISPDGTTQIHALRSEYGLKLEIHRDGVAHPPLMIGFAKDTKADLHWGPEGSGFAVLLVGKGPPLYLYALDLDRGKWLRREVVRGLCLQIPHGA
jgi:hypothetical protein